MPAIYRLKIKLAGNPMATVMAGTSQGVLVGDNGSKGCRGKVPGVTAREDNRQPDVVGPGLFKGWVTVTDRFFEWLRSCMDPVNIPAFLFTNAVTAKSTNNV